MIKLIQMIKQAVLTLVTDDSSVYPRCQAKYNEKTTDVLRYSPYGLDSNPPKDSWVLLVGSQSQEAVKVGFISDMLNRKKELKEGECVLYNTKTKSWVFLKENGDIELDSKNDLIANVVGATTITSTGDVNISASNITLTGNVVIDGITFSAHKHTDVQSGGSETGGPV